MISGADMARCHLNPKIHSQVDGALVLDVLRGVFGMKSDVLSCCEGCLYRDKYLPRPGNKSYSP